MWTLQNCPGNLEYFASANPKKSWNRFGRDVGKRVISIETIACEELVGGVLQLLPLLFVKKFLNGLRHFIPMCGKFAARVESSITEAVMRVRKVADWNKGIGTVAVLPILFKESAASSISVFEIRVGDSFGIVLKQGK